VASIYFSFFSSFFLARHSSSGHQAKFAVLNRGRHLYSAGAAITLGIGLHSSFLLISAADDTSHYITRT